MLLALFLFCSFSFWGFLGEFGFPSSSVLLRKLLFELEVLYPSALNCFGPRFPKIGFVFSFLVGSQLLLCFMYRPVDGLVQFVFVCVGAFLVNLIVKLFCLSLPVQLIGDRRQTSIGRSSCGIYRLFCICLPVRLIGDRRRTSVG